MTDIQTPTVIYTIRETVDGRVEERNADSDEWLVTIADAANMPPGTVTFERPPSRLSGVILGLVESAHSIAQILQMRPIEPGLVQIELLDADGAIIVAATGAGDERIEAAYAARLAR